jgi:ATP adenylyltransferase
MEYISNNVKENGCIFCPGQKVSLRERQILYMGRYALAMMNKYPYINGHLLVAPTRHVPALDQMQQTEIVALISLLNHSLHILKKAMKAEGFNVGLNLGKVAGAGVEEHLHFHVVPRWNGDTNFMTVFGDVRVIPEHMEETYSRLSRLFKEVKENDDA